MPRFTFMVFGIGAALLLSSPVGAKGNWEKHGKKKGVAVFTSAHPHSEVPRVRAVAVVDAPVEDVWAYITGPQMQVKGLKDRKNIGSCGEACDYIYVRLGNWLIEDRHYVVKMEWSKTVVNGQPVYTRTWNKTNARRPVGNDAVPVSNIQGSWQLTSVDGGKRTRVVYINHLDLGGSVPSHLYSMGFVNKAYDIVMNVKSNV